MTALEPCPSCQRHVRTTALACPFCAATLSGEQSRSRSPSGRRLGRYAAFTFQSGLVAAALGCSEGALVTAGTGGGAASGGTTGSGGAASGGTTGSGGAPSGGAVGVGGSSGGNIALGGLGGDDGSGGLGTGGEDLGVPIYGAVPFPK
jgi:hypothetical protein